VLLYVVKIIVNTIRSHNKVAVSTLSYQYDEQNLVIKCCKCEIRLNLIKRSLFFNKKQIILQAMLFFQNLVLGIGIFIN